jgi:hypothetical protein
LLEENAGRSGNGHKSERKILLPESSAAGALASAANRTTDPHKNLRGSAKSFLTATDNMAPSYDNLPVDDDFDENEIDFSDLQEQYEVRLDEGLDSFVVIDGLPKVPEESRQKLTKFLLRKLNDAGKAREEGVYMPMNEETDMTEG